MFSFFRIVREGVLTFHEFGFWFSVSFETQNPFLIHWTTCLKGISSI